jgi:hypothetical protein
MNRRTWPRRGDGRADDADSAWFGAGRGGAGFLMSPMSGCAAGFARLLCGPADAGAAWAAAAADANAELDVVCQQAWTFALGSVFAKYSSVFDKNHSDKDNGSKRCWQQSLKWWVYILFCIGLVDQIKIDEAVEIIDAGLDNVIFDVVFLFCRV